jgi:very-short-patch-repair endonuclease
MEILTQVARLGGAARYSELHASRYQLRHLLETAQLLQLRRGCYALPDATSGARRAVELNGSLSCVSALRFYGVDTPGDAGVVHVSVPSGRGGATPCPAGVRRHHEDAPTGSNHRVVTFLAAATRAAVCLPYDEAVVALDRVTNGRPEMLLGQILTGVARANVSRARAFHIDVDRRSRSRIETLARLALRRAGLATVAGVVIPGVGEVDLLVEGRVIVELDGYAFHSDRQTFRRDRARDRAAARLGFITIRFAFEDSDPDRVVREVLGVVRVPQGSTPGASQSSTSDSPVSENMRLAVQELAVEATGPSARAQGWRLLRGRDRSRVQDSMSEFR